MKVVKEIKQYKPICIKLMRYGHRLYSEGIQPIVSNDFR